MSYRNDQLANLYGNDASGENLTYSSSEQNQEFKYPDRVVRVFDVNGRVDTTGQALTATSEYNRLELKRGYIRSIELPDSGSNSYNRGYNFHKKLNFQFNPSILTQSVSQNTTVLNFMQQSPSDYARPMPGTVTTGFELFFDRTKELNEYSITDDAQIDLSTDSPWEQFGPSVVGVLHDLSMLFDIIGVGVSKKKKDDLIRGLTAEAIADILADDATDEEQTMSEAERAAAAAAQVESFVGLNVGNTAFLLPLPVRIVFSSLYIVEGFVKDVTVTFTKFTHSMVPMQCTVGIMFEAKYIGFAKQDTFLTTSLANALAQEPSDILEESTQITEDHLNILKQDLSKVKMVVVTGDGDSEWGDRDYDFFQSEASSFGNVWKVSSTKSFVSKDVAGPANKQIEDDVELFVKFVLFDNGVIQQKLAGTSTNISVSFNGSYVRIWRFAPDFLAENSDLFSKAREALVGDVNVFNFDIFNVSDVLSKVSNWNPYTSSTNENYRSKLQNILAEMSATWEREGNRENSALAPDSDGTERPYTKVHKLHSLQVTDSKAYEDGHVTATTLKEWNDMRDGRAVAGKYERTVVPSTGYWDRSLNGGDHIADIDYFYYAVEYLFKITVTIDGKSYTYNKYDYSIPLTINSVGGPAGEELHAIKTFDIDWESKYSTEEESNVTEPPPAVPGDSAAYFGASGLSGLPDTAGSGTAPAFIGDNSTYGL